MVAEALALAEAEADALAESVMVAEALALALTVTLTSVAVPVLPEPLPELSSWTASSTGPQASRIETDIEQAKRMGDLQARTLSRPAPGR
ncbi:MAG: hypothetical protein U0168_05065 [Nannocystaceae bacterium]